MKSRKLFPALAENQTADDCSGFCDPACPYNCYPYPDYYYLSPPPPPPPISVKNHYISPYAIILFTVLASLLLLIGYYVVIVKSCFGLCCSRNNRLSRAQTEGSDEEFIDENRVDHPIWFITTVGLQQSVINSITVCKYKKGEGLIEGSECSVCLNEFQEGETVRLLPKCNHAFHISCIDTWLRAHTNCPLCRAHIVFNAVSAPPTFADQSSDNTELVVNNRIENSEIGGEMSIHNQGRDGERCENRVRADDGSELLEATEMQQIKRCVSMDSSSAARSFLGLGKSEGSSFDQQNSSIIPNQDGGNSSEFRPMTVNSSIARQLHLSSVPMKRSFSCGGRFFSSRHCRSMNSILPL